MDFKDFYSLVSDIPEILLKPGFTIEEHRQVLISKYYKAKKIIAKTKAMPPVLYLRVETKENSQILVCFIELPPSSEERVLAFKDIGIQVRKRTGSDIEEALFLTEVWYIKDCIDRKKSKKLMAELDKYDSVSQHPDRKEAIIASYRNRNQQQYESLAEIIKEKDEIKLLDDVDLCAVNGKGSASIQSKNYLLEGLFSIQDVYNKDIKNEADLWKEL